MSRKARLRLIFILFAIVFVINTYQDRSNYISFVKYSMLAAGLFLALLGEILGGDNNE